MQNAKHSLFPGDVTLQDTFKLDWQGILFPGTSGHSSSPYPNECRVRPLLTLTAPTPIPRQCL